MKTLNIIDFCELADDIGLPRLATAIKRRDISLDVRIENKRDLRYKRTYEDICFELQRFL